MEKEDILIVAAHRSEAGAVEETLGKNGLSCEVLVTGVGGMKMSWSLQNRLFSGPRPLIVINTGIAGSYTDTIKTGETVLVASDCFADMGIDDNGRFLSLFSAGLADANEFPFTEGRILCRNRWFDRLQNELKTADAATLNMVSGSVNTISRIISAWNPDIETMEGAWFAFVCEMNRIPWLSLRTISNMVEPRYIKNWDINSALLAMKIKIPGIIKTVLE